MSSYDKVVKGATKPKSGGIKPKYIDPIIATTFATDGSLQDVCRALGTRLRDSNATVVLKSLVILHTMIRNGEVDNVLSHLASDAGNIRLRNVASNSWSGVSAPQTLSVYAQYLDERVRAYRELKHDVIRSSDRSRAHANGASNSNRLRKLSVEKGLLREVSSTQKVASVLMQCSFFLDDLNDDLVMSAFRMTLKDLLAIYTAINEGVINILEHYFEMAKSDAERALELYRRFCRQTENVVAFLNSAKKASHSLNLAIPSLKHAPVSLAGALEEYLRDPNFEQNRKEYKENKRIADGTPSASTARPISTISSSVPKSESKKSITIQEPDKPERKLKPPTANQDLQDFFASIDNDGGQNIFSNVPAEQSFFLQAQPTGMMGMSGAFGAMGMQHTGMGMMQPQMTGYNPFMAQQQTGMPMGMAPQMSGFLQPQQTGFNPFRQSLMPQPTGFGGPFGTFDAQPSFMQPSQQPQQFQQQQQQHQQQQQQQQQPQQAQSPQPQLQPQHTATPSQPQPPSQTGNGFGSTSQPSALSSFNSAFGAPSVNGATPKPVLAQKTGSRNPFAPPPGSTPPPASPPAARGPSLNQLAMNAFAPGGGHYGLGANAWDGTDPTKSAPQATPQQGLVPQKTGLIGSVASEFTAKPQSDQPPQQQQQQPQQQQQQVGGQEGELVGQMGGMSFGVQPQPTGMGGSSVRPFKPESAFGASLASQPQLAVQPQMTGNPFARVASPAAGGVASANTFGGGSTAGGFGNGAGGSTSAFGTGSTAAFGASSTASGFGSNAAGSANASANAGGTALSAFNSAFNPNPQGQQGQGQQGFTSGFNSTQGQQGQGVVPQATGFTSGVRPFQPSSDFGKALASDAQPNLLQF